jgi:serine/threonine-protein kinase RsbW
MKLSTTINCSLDNLKLVRDFIRQALTETVDCPISTNEIILALDEMCSNLIIHAHAEKPEDKIILSVEFQEKEKIIFEIIDEGEPFDITTFEEPDLISLIHGKRKGGLGIRLVKKIMNEIAYFRIEGKNICRLTKIVRD